MTKESFINLVSKINDTYEDEFRGEYNSPELIWKNLITHHFLTDKKAIQSEAYREGYNQGILDLLDKSDGLDMVFQANKLFKKQVK